MGGEGVLMASCGQRTRMSLALHPTMHRTDPATKKCLDPNVK